MYPSRSTSTVFRHELSITNKILIPTNNNQVTVVWWTLIMMTLPHTLLICNKSLISQIDWSHLPKRAIAACICAQLTWPSSSSYTTVAPFRKQNMIRNTGHNWLDHYSNMVYNSHVANATIHLYISMLYEIQRWLSGKTTPSTASTFQHNALGQHADSATSILLNVLMSLNM